MQLYWMPHRAARSILQVFLRRDTPVGGVVTTVCTDLMKGVVQGSHGATKNTVDL